MKSLILTLTLLQVTAYAKPAKGPKKECIAVLAYDLNMDSGIVLKKKSNVTKEDLKRISDLLSSKEFIKHNQIRSISNIKVNKKAPFVCSKK